MPRLLFYVVFATVVVLWMKHYLLPRAGSPRKPRVAPGTMPKQLVCGGCGTAYDPHLSGWICPKCGK